MCRFNSRISFLLAVYRGNISNGLTYSPTLGIMTRCCPSVAKRVFGLSDWTVPKTRLYCLHNGIMRQPKCAELVIKKRFINNHQNGLAIVKQCKIPPGFQEGLEVQCCTSDRNQAGVEVSAFFRPGIEMPVILMRVYFWRWPVWRRELWRRRSF
jgi:hypothetical protein